MLLELTYKNEELKRLCEDASYQKKLIKDYGKEVAKKLPQRIKQLKSMPTVADIPTSLPFKRHKLNGDRKETMAVNVNKQYRIIFKDKNNKIIVEDLRKIDSIEILEVSKHYE